MEEPMFRTLAAITMVTLISLAGQAGAQDRPGNATEGQKLVAERCSACHAVDHPTKEGQQAPSFKSIAEMHSTTSLSLHVFLLTPHPTMPNYRLTSTEVDDVVAYILSFRAL
jgi:mono/diheme cytochrome c family protein